MFLKFDDYKDKERWFDDRVRECRNTYLLPHKKMNVCVDVGSNVGSFVYHASTKFNKIFGFEAVLNNCQIADMFLRKNNIKNFYIRNLAVSDKSGNIIGIHKVKNQNEELSGDASIYNPSNSNEKEDVLTISLEDIFSVCQTEKIDYLKVDCEGSEYSLLYKKHIENIEVIALELHKGYLGEEKSEELMNYIGNYFTIHSKDEFNHFCINKTSLLKIQNNKLL